LHGLGFGGLRVLNFGGFGGLRDLGSLGSLGALNVSQPRSNLPAAVAVPALSGFVSNLLFYA
jgi:hypothetical protein